MLRSTGEKKFQHTRVLMCVLRSFCADPSTHYVQSTFALIITASFMPEAVNRLLAQIQLFNYQHTHIMMIFIYKY